MRFRSICEWNKRFNIYGGRNAFEKVTIVLKGRENFTIKTRPAYAEGNGRIRYTCVPCLLKKRVSSIINNRLFAPRGRRVNKYSVRRGVDEGRPATYIRGREKRKRRGRKGKKLAARTFVMSPSLRERPPATWKPGATNDTRRISLTRAI